MDAEINISIEKQLLIAGCLYMGQFVVGYNLGWTAPVLAMLQNPNDTILEDVITDPQAAWIVSTMNLGSIVGPYLSGYLCNVIGRKPCLYLGGSIFLLAFVILAVSTHLAMIYVGRILTGVGTGIIFVLNLVYIGEMASTRIRGTLLTLTGFSNTVGILFAYSVGPFVPYSVINWIGAALCCTYMVAVFFFVTETAVYQVMKGKKDEAMANLISLGRQDDIEEIVAQANEKPKSNMAQLTEMYTVKSNRKAAFIIISLNILQLSSGIIAVMSFVTIIFDMTESALESHISTIIIGVTQVVAAIFAPILVDRTGKRSLLLVSTAGCSLSLTVLGIYFHLYNTGHPSADSLQWLSLVSIMLFFISYFGGFGIIPNTFIGEMFTDTCRGFGGTFTATIGWVFGFGVTTAFGYMLPALGPSVTFWIFAGVCAFAFFFSIVFVPETKGKSLLEVQELLVYIGQIIVGFSHGWTAPVLAKLQNPDETPLDNVITDGESSWVVSIVFTGSIAGPYLSGYLCNVIGRKPCLYLGGSIFLLAFVILAVSTHLAMIYVGRILTGVGIGIIFVLNLVYIGEMASTRIRGTLLTLTGFSNTLGILFVYSVGPFVPYSVVNWIGAALCCTYMGAVFFFVTETAVYQVMKGKKDEAMANLISLGRQDDIEEIVAQANEKPKSNMAQLTEMYTVKSNRKAAFIIISLNILQLSSGIIAVMSFVTIIFDMTESALESHISTIIIGVTQVVAAIFAPILVDRTGKRSLLLVSTAGCSLSLTVLGIYFHLYNTGHPAADSLQWLSLVSIMLFFISYFGGFGIIPNTFIGEMFTDTCRGFGGTFTATIGWVFGFGVTTAFGYMLPALGPSVTFWIFAGVCAFAFFFSIVFVPETKGKSLLEVQELLGR